jgi:hypothetical protein
MRAFEELPILTDVHSCRHVGAKRRLSRAIPKECFHHSVCVNDDE